MQTNRSLAQSNKQILQKDLSFSNSIFKKTLHNQNMHSSKNSNQNLTINHLNFIPPLVKYHEELPQLNTYNQNSTKFEINQENYSNKQQKYQRNDSQQQMGIFQRKLKVNPLQYVQLVNKKQQNFSSIPSLSLLQEKLAKKYQRIPLNDKNQESNLMKPTVHFDSSQNQHSITNRILNIESLEESRIANDTIEKQNNWMVKGMGENSGYFEQNDILNNLGKNDEVNKKNTNNRSFMMNNSLRNINPLQLVNNSLYVNSLPEFVEDDYEQQQQTANNNTNHFIEQNKQGITKNSSRTIQQQLRAFNNLNSYQQTGSHQQQNGNSGKQTKRQTDFRKLTLAMFQHYVSPYFLSQSPDIANQLQTESVQDSILINDFQSAHVGFNNLTTKSSPLRNPIKILPSSNAHINTISELNLQQNSFQEDNSQFTTTSTKIHQHFINDKTPKEIISAILRDPNKLKTYIKYLQMKIALHNSNQNQLPDFSQNYQILTCLLEKISQISQKTNKNSFEPRSLAQQILNLSRFQQSKNAQRQQAQNMRPQIIRSSSNNIKINFDPYLSYQTEKINAQISFLKRSIEEKKKQAQLIKLNYDAVIHNYATTLENLSKNKQNKKSSHSPQQIDSDTNENINHQQQSQQNNNNRKSQNYSEKFEHKNYLQVFAMKNRSSLQFQENKSRIHRKATFGKVPSSFKGSDALDQ